MSQLAKAIAMFLGVVADYLRELQRRKDAAKQQSEADALQKNPAGWFARHFNGVQPVPNKADTTTETAAAKSDSDK